MDRDNYYKHKTVNHSKNFVNPKDKSIHTQTMEGTWNHLRKSLPTFGTCADHLMSYTMTFSWRKRFGKNGNGFRNLINNIKELYDPNRENEDPFANIETMEEYWVPPGVEKIPTMLNEEEEEVAQERKKKVPKKKKRKRGELQESEVRLTRRQLSVLENKEFEDLKNKQLQRARNQEKKRT